ncbi:hypothetical protein QE450_003937 [Paenibacillus sp. SORGH_AS306]|uniref:hypothetical protein n=1 Tax=unclassified Paenibacillus TaxID=185978 RepID=UPI002784223E|nr:MULTISPECIES: hypothetical protein [unclassified Paenibacillus]MDQ1236439.1 hypothetical protein [Paenibacillus sp. SORGH_AS_0306]MDR6108792.1 hypothetical protein [Paenibacillus sp. SORGH_AS_0338]
MSKTKLLSFAIATLAVGTIVYIGVGTTPIQDISAQDVTPADPAPFEVQQKQEHPDAIVTKDGRYDKNNQTEQVFKTNEIVHDAQQTNESTKVIIQNGDTFIKLNNQ